MDTHVEKELLVLKRKALVQVTKIKTDQFKFDRFSSLTKLRKTGGITGGL